MSLRPMNRGYHSISAGIDLDVSDVKASQLLGDSIDWSVGGFIRQCPLKNLKGAPMLTHGVEMRSREL